jgi:von Willebrand factor type A domain
VIRTKPFRLSLLVTLIGVGLAVLGMATGAAHAQVNIGKFQQIGCYYNKMDNNRLWLGTIALDPKFANLATYDDQDNQITATILAGDLKREYNAGEFLVHPMNAFNFKEASKYQFLKYSLVLDYSSSIPEKTRGDYLDVLHHFLGKLPLAMEGQLIRFSDTVEVYPFTKNVEDIRNQIRAPIAYGMTTLNDALMAAASGLIKDGSNVPIRIIILFTDGFENYSTQYKDKVNFLSTFTSLVKAERIAVLAVGVSRDQDKATLSAITDRNNGITGHFISIPDFDKNKFKDAFDKVLNWVNNTVIFRIPKFGPDAGKVTIRIGSKSKSGNTTTIQEFECEY